MKSHSWFAPVRSSLDLPVRVAAAFLLAFSVLLVALLGVATPASGQTSCEQVVDETGQIDVADVADAAADISPDIQVLVRAYDVAPGGLEQAAQDVVDACAVEGSKWIFIGVSLDPAASGILPGPGTGISDEVAEEIRTGAMRDALRNGDFNGGLVAALVDLDVRLEEAAGSVGLENAPTSNDAGDNRGNIAVGGILAGTAAVGGATLVLSRRRKLVSRRNSLNAKVSEPLVKMGAARERAVRLAEKDQRFEHTVSGRTMDELREHQAEVRNEGNEAERTVSLLNQATPEGIKNASTSELVDAEARLVEFESALERYSLALDRFTAFGELLDRLRVSLPAKQELLLSEIEEASHLVETRRKEGWVVIDPEQKLQAASTNLGVLDMDALKVDLLELSDQVEDAEAELFAARHELQTLPDKLKNFLEWAERLEISEREERHRIVQTERLFAEEAQHHAQDSWSFVADNGDVARKYLDRSASLRIDTVGTAEVSAGPLKAQNWSAVTDGLEQSGLALIAADSQMDEVDVLFVDLRQARIEAPDLLVAARQELGELQEFIRDNQRDLGRQFQVEPAQIEAVLAEMHGELRTRQPNHLRVARTLDRLDRQMDEILAQAEEEAARVAALRREVAREVARANRAIQRAEQTLGWTVFSSEKRDLKVLEHRLRNMPNTLEEQIIVAQDVADDAIALRERIILRRRRNNTWVIVGGSGGWGGGNRSGGGWSSGGSTGSGGGGFFSGGGGGFSGGGGSFGGGGGGSFGGGGGSFGGF